MRRLAPLALVLLAVATTACKVVPASPDETANSRASTTEPALGDTVRIEAGASVSWNGGRFVVTFDSLGSDSRCPANAMCVWQGDVPVRFRLSADGRRSVSMLHTGIEPRQVESSGYRLRLVNVEPYPGTYDPEKPAPAPLAVVVVTRK